MAELRNVAPGVIHTKVNWPPWEKKGADDRSKTAQWAASLLGHVKTRSSAAGLRDVGCAFTRRSRPTHGYAGAYLSDCIARIRTGLVD